MYFSKLNDREKTGKISQNLLFLFRALLFEMISDISAHFFNKKKNMSTHKGGSRWFKSTQLMSFKIFVLLDHNRST